MQNCYTSCFSLTACIKRISGITSTELSVTVRLSAGMRISQSQQGTQFIRPQQDGGGQITAYIYLLHTSKCVVTAPCFLLTLLYIFIDKMLHQANELSRLPGKQNGKQRKQQERNTGFNDTKANQFPSAHIKEVTKNRTG